jgi:hypothetical protein
MNERRVSDGLRMSAFCDRRTREATLLNAPRAAHRLDFNFPETHFRPSAR